MVNSDMKLLSQKLKSYLKAICKLACDILIMVIIYYLLLLINRLFQSKHAFFVIICTPKVKTTLREVLMMLENQLTDLTTSAIIPFQFSALLKMVNMS